MIKFVGGILWIISLHIYNVITINAIDMDKLHNIKLTIMVRTVWCTWGKSNSIECPDEETTVMATIGNKRVAFSLASTSDSFSFDMNDKYTIKKEVYMAENTASHQSVHTKYICSPLVMRAMKFTIVMYPMENAPMKTARDGSTW